MPILITLLALGFVIFIHELGHLLAAKKAKVGVTEFAIGMGPKLFSFHLGETMYSLRLLPFGGFVKAKGLDDLEDCSIEEDYREKSALDKAIILFAGSFMNVVLGFLIFTSISFFVGNITLSPEINLILEGSPAQESGLMVGDQVTHINGSPIEDLSNDFIGFVKSSDGEPFELKFLRDGNEETITLAAESTDQGHYQIGVSFSTIKTKLGLLNSIITGWSKTFKTIQQSLQGIKLLISGQANVNDLAGPVGIIQIASTQMQQSLVTFFNLMAFISISLGVINLLPFPVLDGGHLMFLLIETLRGKPLSKNVETFINNSAAIALITLMIFIVFNDVISWNDRVNLLKELNQ
ncbi:MAG: RIP metalloprotease RseP [Candidatus Margulisiibacteriota bacterium]